LFTVNDVEARLQLLATQIVRFDLRFQRCALRLKVGDLLRDCDDTGIIALDCGALPLPLFGSFHIKH
jgi:hypothetical protein